MLRNLYNKLFMYGLYPRPWQKFLGLFLGKPPHIIVEESGAEFVEGMKTARAQQAMQAQEKGGDVGAQTKNRPPNDLTWNSK